MNKIKRIKNVLKCNKGEGFPLAIAITIALILIMLGVGEYFRIMIISQGVRDSLQDAVISTVTENYADVYHSVREGYAGAYKPVNGDFEESINYGDIYARLVNTHDLSYNNEVYSKTKLNDELEFMLYDLRVEVNNSPIGGGDISVDRFEIDSYITLEVPMSFAGNILPNIKIRLKTSAGYTPIF